MSTARFAQPRRGPLAAASEDARRTAQIAPKALAAALIAAVLYAAFAHGAAGSPAEPRLQVSLAAMAALAAGAWLWSGTLRFAVPRLAGTGVALLVAFAVWSGITVLWSASPDQTWLELNRTLSYVLVVCLAIALGASYARALQDVASGMLLVSLAVACYGLGQKLLPGLHVPGVFNLNQTARLPRVQQPFGYWNALALFVAIGIPIALAYVLDQTRSRRVRLASVVTLELMLLAIASTFARGGVLALVLGLVAGIGLSGARLRSLMWLAAAVVASAPPIVFGLTEHSLTTAGVSIGDREAAGLVLAAILAASLLALIVGTRKLLELEEWVYVGPTEARRIGHRLLALAGVLVVAGVLAVALSSRGVGGTVSHAWNGFTATHATGSYDTPRVLSADSENRWVWWKEAAGAFSDRPLGGWGAGSFGVLHLLYRRDALSVRQPHSVPLQWLAETGILGALLAICAYGLLLATAVRTARRHSVGPERVLVAAFVAGAVAYAVHALYDWDWDIPGVTLPALLFLGVIAGHAGRSQAPSELVSARAMRALALTCVTIGLCSFALSATLPSLAASKAKAALVAASSGAPDALSRAQSTAELASKLDPLSDSGRTAQATIALRRGDPGLARSYLLDAVRRNPSDPQAWSELALVEVVYLGDLAAGRQAAHRVLGLDPRGRLDTKLATGVLQRADVLETPPAGSAAATPLPPGFTARTRAAAGR